MIVFALPESSATSTARNTLSPALDLALGLIALVVALALGTGPHHRFATAGKAQAGEGEEGPSPLAPGTRSGLSLVAFAVGAALSLPGASYLIALDILHKHDLAAGATVVCVIAFCLIEMRSSSCRSSATPSPRTGRAAPEALPPGSRGTLAGSRPGPRS